MCFTKSTYNTLSGLSDQQVTARLKNLLKSRNFSKGKQISIKLGNELEAYVARLHPEFLEISRQTQEHQVAYNRLKKERYFMRQDLLNRFWEEHKNDTPPQELISRLIRSLDYKHLQKLHVVYADIAMVSEEIQEAHNAVEYLRCEKSHRQLWNLAVKRQELENEAHAILIEFNDYCSLYDMFEVGEKETGYNVELHGKMREGIQRELSSDRRTKEQRSLVMKAA